MHRCGSEGACRKPIPEVRRQSAGPAVVATKGRRLGSAAGARSASPHELRMRAPGRQSGAARYSAPGWTSCPCSPRRTAEAMQAPGQRTAQSGNLQGVAVRPFPPAALITTLKRRLRASIFTKGRLHCSAVTGGFLGREGLLCHSGHAISVNKSCPSAAQQGWVLGCLRGALAARQSEVLVVALSWAGRLAKRRAVHEVDASLRQAVPWLHIAKSTQCTTPVSETSWITQGSYCARVTEDVQGSLLARRGAGAS